MQSAALTSNLLQSISNLPSGAADDAALLIDPQAAQALAMGLAPDPFALLGPHAPAWTMQREAAKKRWCAPSCRRPRRWRRSTQAVHAGAIVGGADARPVLRTDSQRPPLSPAHPLAWRSDARDRGPLQLRAAVW